MNFVFLLSVILKAVGAVFEILIQILITKVLGVSGYGDYSAWINVADLIFWMFFSGIIKCNTFYLAGENTKIRVFKFRYYFRYVTPVILLLSVFAVLAGRSSILYLVIAITVLELIVYDQSSTLIARKRMKKSLIGEYVLGRAVLILGVVFLNAADRMNIMALLLLYLLQYIIVVLFFLTGKSGPTENREDISGTVSLKKWGSYQWADLMHSLISQMPVVVQYIFSGAFEAGVVSIVLLVKKLIGFISGPTAKIFLPEFSRLYRTGDKAQMGSYYAGIMRMQMLFIGPMAVVLLAFPAVILQILAEELLEYTGLFMLCSVIFLLTAMLGPCGGILQMTGNEKADNRCREVSILVMLAVMIFLRQDKLFVLYGLCAQTAVEAVGKYAFICRWLKISPVKLRDLFIWWLVPVAVIAITTILQLGSSPLWMIVFAGGVFMVEGLNELKGIRSAFRGKGSREA